MNRTEQNRVKRFFTHSAAVLTMCATSFVANAQLSISEVVYEIDGWEIISLVDNNEVDSLLLFRLDSGSNPESSINAVLAQRIGDGWNADAWVGEDTPSVVLWAADNLGLPDPTDSDFPWPIDDISEAVAGEAMADDPVPFADGVLASSPFEPVVDMLENPKPFLEALELNGAAAASSTAVSAGKVDADRDIGDADGSNCTFVVVPAETTWNAVADSINAHIEGVGDIHDVFNDTTDPQNLTICCRPRRIIFNLPSTGPVCGPWGIFHINRASNGATVTVIYTRAAVTTLRRQCTRTSILCAITSVNQTRTSTRSQQFRVTFNRTSNGYDAATFVPPAIPPSAPACAGNAGGTTWTGWTPGC